MDLVLSFGHVSLVKSKQNTDFSEKIIREIIFRLLVLMLYSSHLGSLAFPMERLSLPSVLTRNDALLENTNESIIRPNSATSASSSDVCAKKSVGSNRITH